MDEKTWVQLEVVDQVARRLRKVDSSLTISAGHRLSYANEIRRYEGDQAISDDVKYETDILVTEAKDGVWKPRIVVEAKVGKITTHDAITYSEKAFHHKKVHPYLRYGIVIGNRRHFPLPGRLFRHGAYFDFMLSWVGFKSKRSELNSLLDLLVVEVKASRDLEEILYNSRRRHRAKYTVLHKPLVLR
jgi:hypothetical protein